MPFDYNKKQLTDSALRGSLILKDLAEFTLLLCSFGLEHSLSPGLSCSLPIPMLLVHSKASGLYFILFFAFKQEKKKFVTYYCYDISSKDIFLSWLQHS